MKWLWFIVFFTASILSFSQQSETDSLQKVLLTAKSDTNKVKTLVKLCWNLEDVGDYAKAKQYADSSLALSLKLNYKKGAANSYNESGIVLRRIGNYPEALKNHFAALKLREELGDKKGIASSYNNIGVIYGEQNNLTEALKNYSACLAIMKEIKNKKGIAASYNNIGNNYDKQGDYKNALKNHFAALEIKKEIGDESAVAFSYGNIGLIYLEEAEHEPNPAARAPFYSNALKYQLADLKIMEEIKNMEGLATGYINLGVVYLKLNNLAEARKQLDAALALSKKIGSKDDMKESYSNLSVLDSMQGNYKASYENYKNYIACRDSVLNEENTKRTVRLQMQYEFDKREADAKAEAQVKDAKAKVETKKQQIILWSVVSCLLLVVGFAFFIFRSYSQIKKKNREISAQKQMIEEKQKEILDSIHYARRIQDAILPRENYIDKTLKRLMRK